MLFLPQRRWGVYTGVLNVVSRLSHFISIKLCIFFPFAGVEKKNDDFRRFFHSKINKWDTCKDLLVVEKLENTKRTPRKYVKKSQAFWCNGGKQAVARSVKRKAVEDLPPPPLPSPPTAGKQNYWTTKPWWQWLSPPLPKSCLSYRERRLERDQRLSLFSRFLKNKNRELGSNKTQLQIKMAPLGATKFAKDYNQWSFKTYVTLIHNLTDQCIKYSPPKYRYWFSCLKSSTYTQVHMVHKILTKAFFSMRKQRMTVSNRGLVFFWG